MNMWLCMCMSVHVRMLVFEQQSVIAFVVQIEMISEHLRD